MSEIPAGSQHVAMGSSFGAGHRAADPREPRGARMTLELTALELTALES